MTIKKVIAACSLFLLAGIAHSKEQYIPPCYGPERWSATLAVSHMVNSGILNKEDAVTQNSKEMKTSLLEGRKIGIVSDPEFKNAGLYRQIQKIELKNNKGVKFETITISETSDLECSMTSPTIILISPEVKILNKGESFLELKEKNLLP